MNNRHTKQPGFILPALIVFSLVLMSVGLVVVQYVASSTNSVQSSYYNNTAKEAANAGAMFAYSCIRNDATNDARWSTPVVTTTVPLTPDKDCSGATTAAPAYVGRSDSGSWQSTYTVGAVTTDLSGKRFSVEGKVDFFYAGSSTPTRTFTATTNVNIPYDLTASTVPRAVGKAVTQMDSGSNFSCAVANSQLYCWGLNDIGQLGFGDNTNRDRPTLVTTGALGTKRVTSAQVGLINGCATADGRAYCWGVNQRGQLGNGTSPGFLADWDIFALIASTRYQPTKVTGPLDNANVTEVNPSWTTSNNADRSHTCALTNGQVYCWGSNFWAQLAQPKYDGLVNALCVANGWVTATIFFVPSEYLCAQNQNTGGGLIENHDEYLPVPIYGFANRKSGVSGSEANTALLYENRGDGTYGKRVSDLDAGMYGSCLIADGSVYCWGDSQFDIRGSADPTGSLNNKSVNAIKEGTLTGKMATSVAASGTTGCAIADGRLNCWGRLRGDGTNLIVGNDTPKEVALPTSNAQHSIGASSNRYVDKVKSSTEQSGPICATGSGSAFCWGIGSPNTLSPILANQVDYSEAITDMGAGGGVSILFGMAGIPGATCMLANMTPYCVGNNSAGQIGAGFSGVNQANFLRTYNNGPADANTIGLTAGAAATEISAGATHNCAVINGGAYCWGRNNSGQLGVNDTLDRAHPIGVTNLSAIKTVSKVGAGTNHSCAISDGRAWCWGNQQTNKLGNGVTTNTNQTIPVAVTGGANSIQTMNVTDISVGSDHTCAVANSKVFCWGLNTSGQLGQGNTNVQTSVVQVNGLLAGKAVTKVAVGNNFSCAIANGRTYCWGSDANGQLGNGATGSTTVPGLVTTMTGAVTDIQAGTDFACAIEAGIPKCWGSRLNGRLGDNGATTGTQQTPVLVNGMGGSNPRNTTSLSLGTTHACAIANGINYCWGSRADGRLGDNSASSQVATPSATTEVNVSGQFGPQNTPYKVSAGGSGSCAIANARIYCWGANDYGQIGNDVASTTDLLTPTGTTDYTRDTTVVSWNDTVFF